MDDPKNYNKAFENAYKKVLWTIVDANVTTLIAALVRMETNSSGPIKGFALTLILGLFVSLFTAKQIKDESCVYIIQLCINGILTYFKFTLSHRLT